MDSSHNHDRTSRRVGLVYDDRMCKHSTPNGEDHPENPNRIKAIWSKLEAAGIPQRCEVFSAQEAEDRYIELVHTKKHIDLIRNISSRVYDKKRKRNKIAAGFDSIYLNKGSSQAAYLAAGSVIEVSERIAKGELNSAVAIVRPPGHHAEPDEAMGFCIFNNVAIAASFLLNERPELGVQKILIVDWDVHHGNGTQKMFWKDPRVLFFSVHRFDFGSFYPSGDDGSHSMVGEGSGAGYNVNVPWEHGGCGDADYFAVWDHILIPIAKAFNPDMILISGGFDAAVGDPLGGCRVTPYGYSIMMKKLMEFAHGRIMMALEGGYNLDSLANSVFACVETLLKDKPIVGSSEAYPFESTWRVIQAVRQELSTFWPILTDELPKDLLLTTNKTPSVEELAEGSEKLNVTPEEVDPSTSALEGQEKTPSFSVNDLLISDNTVVGINTQENAEKASGSDGCLSGQLGLGTTISFRVPLSDADLPRLMGFFQSSISCARVERDAFRNKLESISSSHEKVVAERDTFEADCVASKKRVSELVSQVDSLDAEKQKILMVKHDLEGKLEDAASSRDRAVADIKWVSDRLEKELKTSKELVESLNSSLLDANKRMEVLTTHRDELSDRLNNEVAAKDTAHAEIENWRSSYDALGLENDQLKSAKNALQIEVASLKSAVETYESDGVVVELRARVAELEYDVSELDTENIGFANDVDLLIAKLQDCQFGLGNYRDNCTCMRLNEDGSIYVEGQSPLKDVVDLLIEGKLVKFDGEEVVIREEVAMSEGFEGEGGKGERV